MEIILHDKQSLILEKKVFGVFRGKNKKGESKVPIFGQGGAIKRPPMDEMT